MSIKIRPDTGEPERAWEAVYADAYDAVAMRVGLPPGRRPMTREQRAEAAEAEVLAEPVTVRRSLWWERVFWRGAEYRSREGACRARAVASRKSWASVART